MYVCMYVCIYTHTHRHTLFKILFPYRSLQSIQKYSMCYMVGPYHVSVLSLLVMSDSLPPIGLQPARLLCPWNFSGRNTGVGCHFLLQGIFTNQGSNPCLFHLLYSQVGSLPLYHLESPGPYQLSILYIVVLKYLGPNGKSKITGLACSKENYPNLPIYSSPIPSLVIRSVCYICDSVFVL